jgi:C1A family cysteine protease
VIKSYVFSQGVISPVRGQSMCGSCWAFSTAGMLEGVYKIAVSFPNIYNPVVITYV